MVDVLGGTVKKAAKREYGYALLQAKSEKGIFSGVDKITPCWMSHGDSIKALPKGFKITASTKNAAIAAMANHRKNHFGLQFHPEVHHTPQGQRMLKILFWMFADVSLPGRYHPLSMTRSLG